MNYNIDSNVINSNDYCDYCEINPHTKMCSNCAIYLCDTCEQHDCCCPCITCSKQRLEDSFIRDPDSEITKTLKKILKW